MWLHLGTYCCYILCKTMGIQRERQGGKWMHRRVCVFYVHTQSILVQHNQHYSRRVEKSKYVNTEESGRIYREGDLGRSSRALTWQTS